MDTSKNVQLRPTSRTLRAVSLVLLVTLCPVPAVALPPMAWNHKGTAHVDEQGNTVLPPDVADEVLAHLKYAERMPELCDQEKEMEKDVFIEELTRTSDALESAEKAKKSAEEQRNLAVGVGIGGTIVGILVGLIVGIFGNR